MLLSEHVEPRNSAENVERYVALVITLMAVVINMGVKLVKLGPRW